MPVVPDERRIEELRRLGISDPVIRQSASEEVHPIFSTRCKPPFYSYHGAVCPAGPPLVPLWDSGDTVTAVWQPDDRLEFIEFRIECRGEYQVLARTEQGLLANLFVNLLEDEDDVGPEQRETAATLIGFRFLPEVIAAYQAADHKTTEAHEAFRRRLMNSIDQLGG